MNNIGVYLFDKNTDEEAVMPILKKYGVDCVKKQDPNNLVLIDDKFTSNIYKVFAEYNGGAQLLERVAKVLNKGNCDKKFEKFNKKLILLQQQLRSARDIANTSNDTSAGRSYTGGSILDLVSDKADAVQSNPEVMKAQAKIDNFLEKNKVIYHAQFYSKEPGSSGVDMIGINLMSKQSASNNIKDAITAAQDNDTALVQSLAAFMSMLRELLAVAKDVAFMVVNDGKDGSEILSQKTYSIARLKIDNVANAKNRELKKFTN